MASTPCCSAWPLSQTDTGRLAVAAVLCSKRNPAAMTQLEWPGARVRAAFNEFFQSKAHTYWASNAVVSCQLHAEKQQAAAVPSWLSRAQHGICRSMIAAILHQSARSKREALQQQSQQVSAGSAAVPIAPASTAVVCKSSRWHGGWSAHAWMFVQET